MTTAAVNCHSKPHKETSHEGIHSTLCNLQQGSFSCLMQLPVPVIRVRFPAPSLSGMLPWR